MTCEETRALLPELVLGTITDHEQSAALEHLRGCAGCRAEVDALDRGLVAVTLAAPSIEATEPLKERVMSAVREEWNSEGAQTQPLALAPTIVPPPAEVPARRPRVPWVAAGAAVIALVAVLVWGGGALREAERRGTLSQATLAKADRYDAFLGALGGENVRVGRMQPAPGVGLAGSVVVYDSTVGQNWVLGLVRAPEIRGKAVLVLDGPAGSLRLHPMELEDGGEASAWLVTERDLRGFDAFSLRDEQGNPLATGTLV